MLDGGETDWKVIAISAEEAAERGIRGLEDLERVAPGLASAVQNFFRLYKVPDGEGENEFAYNGELQGPELAGEVIR